MVKPVSGIGSNFLPDLDTAIKYCAEFKRATGSRINVQGLLPAFQFGKGKEVESKDTHFLVKYFRILGFTCVLKPKKFFLVN